MSSRRHVLKVALASAASRALGRSATPLLGLIQPVEATVPPEAATLYPSGVRFQALSVGLETMTPAGYDRVLEHIAPTAEALARAGADAIVLMGTSLSFYRGANFNRELTRRIRVASGRPAITMSTAVCDGLRAFRARRLAVATAYDTEVNRRLQSFLHEEGFDVRVIRGLGVEKVEAIKSVTRAGLMKFSTEVFRAADGAEALLISCGGLHTLDMLAALEERCGVPVVSSLPHALRAGVRLLGLSGHVEGYGRLFRLTAAP
ncbi:MAG: aspartate/glutamate racemase family protein [Steroidobacteraceae bacterium]